MLLRPTRNSSITTGVCRTAGIWNADRCRVDASASVMATVDAFAGLQAVGLHHDRRAVLLHVGLRGLRIAKFREAGGRDLVRGAKLLGEGLGAFELRGDRLGAESLDAGFSRSSTSPATSGASGPTTTRSIGFALQKAATAAWSAILRLDDLRFLGDARIARRRIELGQERARGELPGERMLASAGAEEQYFHGRFR